MPDFFTRMHAASVTDTLGAGLLIIGLILQAGFTLIAVKLLFLGLLLLFASPDRDTRVGQGRFGPWLATSARALETNHRSADHQHAADVDGA